MLPSRRASSTAQKNRAVQFARPPMPGCVRVWEKAEGGKLAPPSRVPALSCARLGRSRSRGRLLLCLLLRLLLLASGSALASGSVLAYRIGSSASSRRGGLDGRLDGSVKL